MKRRKHKRRLNHVLILTSDAADANVKQFRVRAWIVEVVVFLLCVLVGGVIGYFVYEGQLWENAPVDGAMNRLWHWRKRTRH